MPRRAVVPFIVLLASLAGCTSHDASSDVVHDLYATLRQVKVSGAPDEEQLSALRPFLSADLQQLLLEARERRDAEQRRAPDEKPPFVEGDLFTSSFEGHTGAKIVADSAMPDSSHRVSVQFTNDASPPAVEWVDVVVLRREGDHMVVTDVEYGADWPFGNHGTLTESLEAGLRSGNEAGVVITLADGRTLILADDTTQGDSYVRHTYRGRVRGMPFQLVQQGYFEGQSYLLVHDTTGGKIRVDAPPVVSPDGRRFVTASMDLEAAFDPTRLMVWRIEGDTAITEFSLEPDEWGPSAPRWRGADTVEFTANLQTTEPGRTRPVAGRLARNGEAWSLLAPRSP